MVQNAWQEQRCSVLNKPDGLNHLSDRRTTSFVQDSFVKTIKKHFKRQIRLTLLSVCSFEKAISACLGRIHLVIFHDVHQALKFLPPNKFPRQSSKDTHTHTHKIATHKEQWNLRWNLYFWGIQPLDVLLNSSFKLTGQGSYISVICLCLEICSQLGFQWVAAQASHSLIFHDIHQNKLPPNKFPKQS